LIAQWLGEYEERTVYPLGRTYSTQWYTECVRELDDGMIVEAEWPDYTLDDAAAWRLCNALDSCHFSRTPTHEYDEKRRYRVTVWLDKKGPAFRAYAGTKATGLVLAVCKLIDEGIKSRGCA
jgi:hypothetical protein